MKNKLVLRSKFLLNLVCHFKTILYFRGYMVVPEGYKSIDYSWLFTVITDLCKAISAISACLNWNWHMKGWKQLTEPIYFMLAGPRFA